MILIIGEPVDPHIKTVTRELKKRKVKFRVVDPFTNVLLPEIHLPQEGKPTSPYQITSIWDRLKPVATGQMDEKAQYLIRERSALMRSFQWLAEGSSRLMNCPSATERCRSKPLQLKIAANAGFRTPKTYIGNDPATILDFVAGCPYGAIAKSLTWFVSVDGQMFFTQQITKDFLETSKASIAYSPLIYQEYVPKNYELRITCVGSELFSAKIISQVNPKARIDWRRDQFNLEYERIVLAPKIRDKIVALQNAFGLSYGAYDFIITPEDELCFLEVNPSGNWLWLEKLLGLDISKEIACWLSLFEPKVGT